MDHLNYTDLGHGEVIVLLHGFCESLKLWEDYQQELAKFARVIALDLPGFGSSRIDNSEVTIDNFAKSVDDLMKYLNIDHYHVCGHSLGGYVALAMAEKWPYKLKSMVLFHSTSYPDTLLKKNNRDKAAEFITRNGLSVYMDSFVAPLFAENNREKNKKAIAMLIAEGKKADPEVVVNTIMAMKNRPDRKAVLSQLTCPVLMIIGDEDVAIPIEDSLAQTELSNHIQSLVLSNCGHMGMIEKPQTCLSRLTEFYYK
jgi:pimeloyl-ACP methyl ester carboxylesterase